MSKREVTEMDLRMPEFQDPKLTLDMLEFDKDGSVVRKDRFEKGMHRILGVLIEHGLASSREPWTVDEVVEKVKEQFAKHEDGSYIQIEVENAKKVFQHQEAKVEELQEEFAEDERFLKEQIKNKDLKISNLEYLQGMDKDLIQTLQGRSTTLQDKINGLQKRVDSAISNIENFFDEQTQQPTQREYANFLADVLHDLKEEQALKGEG